MSLHGIIIAVYLYTTDIFCRKRTINVAKVFRLRYTNVFFSEFPITDRERGTQTMNFTSCENAKVQLYVGLKPQRMLWILHYPNII